VYFGLSSRRRYDSYEALEVLANDKASSLLPFQECLTDLLSAQPVNLSVFFFDLTQYVKEGTRTAETSVPCSISLIISMLKEGTSKVEISVAQFDAGLGLLQLGG